MTDLLVYIELAVLTTTSTVTAYFAMRISVVIESRLPILTRKEDR